MKKKWVLRYCDLNLWPKITINRVWASVVSNHLAKNASKSVHPLGWNFVYNKTSDTHRHRHTHRQTHKQTNCSENTTLLRFRGGVIDYFWIRNELILRGLCVCVCVCVWVCVCVCDCIEYFIWDFVGFIIWPKMSIMHLQNPFVQAIVFCCNIIIDKRRLSSI